MFTTKKQPEATTKSQTSVAAKQPFIQQGMKTAATTVSENGAVKYSETDNSFVTQFGLLGSYRAPRPFTDISRDMSTLWAIDPRLAIMFTLFIRMITRVVALFDGRKTEAVQRGAGLKHESIMRMIWLGVNHPDSFKKNLHLFVSVGSWKDVIQMMSYDFQYNGFTNKTLDWSFLANFVMAGIENPNTRNLVLKYLPNIKTKSKCTTIEAQANNVVAKYLCSTIFVSKNVQDVAPFVYKQYRKLKTSGTAHDWQQKISRRLFDQIDFNTVHGRALAQMVGSKFLANHNLTEKYSAWIASKPTAKYTGFVHELFAKLPSAQHEILTLNAQFNQLVEVAKQGITTTTGMIVVRDTSGSMGGIATGSTMSCFNIAKALALFFSKMLPDGEFTNSWIEFNSTAMMKRWSGSTAYENWMNDRSSYVGSTNFQSVINLFIKIKISGIPEKNFPSGIICISDSEFNSTGLETNYITAMRALRKHFSEEYVNNFKVVLWNLQSNGRGNKFETHSAEARNVFYFSGYDGSTIAFLTGQNGKETPPPKNASELFAAAMKQEVLDMVEV